MKNQNIQSMVEKFKEITPDIKVQKQPDLALQKLIQLERKFQLNTRDIVVFEEMVNESIRDEWLEAYRVFYIHKGDFLKINTIK